MIIIDLCQHSQGKREDILSTFFYETRSENLFAGFICDHPFPMHLHDAVEIICITCGHVRLTVDGCVCDMHPGDIAAAFPSTPHSYDDVSPDAQGLTLIFVPETIGEFIPTFRSARPVSPFLPSERKAPELDNIIQKLLQISAQGDPSLRTAYLHVFLAHLMQCLELRSMERGAEQGMSHRLLHYISEHFSEPLSLESTARALGVSRIHVSHIFSQQLRINFRQYINTLRIDRARSLLRDPAYTISQVAYLCGYENPRTFHRAFQAQCHCTPREYRAGPEA